ncbi:MAG: SLAC1 anion channel family protein [Betaproteobacteria bacterium]|jgi:tellurite resistance protein
MSTPNSPSAAPHSPSGNPFLDATPIGAFAMVMGLSGLALVWGKLANLGWLPGVAGPLAVVFAAIDGLAFVLLLALYAKKWARNHQRVYEEWQHPVKSSFFAAVSVSFALTATVALGAFAPLALPLWVIGAVLQAIAMVMVLNAWIHRESLQPPHATPAWFIPAVANVVLPLAGVRLGFLEISWWFFAVGILFWLVLLTVVLQRLLFVQPALPERLVPTLCILLAPPAVAFLSWLQLTGQHPGSAPLDPMGHVLFGIAIFFALFLFTQIRRFLRLSFYVSWWAFSFPSAAFTNAALVYAQFEGGAFNQALAVAMVAFSTLLILWLLIRTIVAVARNEPQLTD